MELGDDFDSAEELAHKASITESRRSDEEEDSEDSSSEDEDDIQLRRGPLNLEAPSDKPKKKERPASSRMSVVKEEPPEFNPVRFLGQALKEMRAAKRPGAI